VAPPIPSDDGASRRTLGFAIGGVGVAGLAAGAGTGIVALMKHGELTDPGSACHASGTCSSVASSGKALSWASTATFAVGIAGVAVGIYLVVSGPRPPRTVTLGIAPGPGGARMEVESVF
jgi:hypothetical protein